MKSRARSIFDHAQVYERAARLLNTAGTSDPAMLLPSMVNAALSLELYFKSLYVIDRGAEFKVIRWREPFPIPTTRRAKSDS